jgi:hypothetical protein
LIDFMDIRAASKDEQIRAWAVEQAVLITDTESMAETVIYKAGKIEAYVKNGAANG